MKVDLTRVGLEAPDANKNAVRAGQAPGASGANSAEPAGGTAGADRARLFFDRARVQSLEAQVLAQPEVREAKVQALQQAISNGKYSVSASQVADALLRDGNTA